MSAIKQPSSECTNDSIVSIFYVSLSLPRVGSFAVGEVQNECYKPYRCLKWFLPPLKQFPSKQLLSSPTLELGLQHIAESFGGILYVALDVTGI